LQINFFFLQTVFFAKMSSSSTPLSPAQLSTNNGIARTKPTLAAYARMSVDELLAVLEPVDDVALAQTFSSVVRSDRAAEFSNDRRVVARSILALTANKQNIKLLEQATTLKERHRAWLQNKAATATTDLLDRATRKRARDDARQLKQQQARPRVDDNTNSGSRESNPLRSAALASTASQFSNFLVAVDFPSSQKQDRATTQATTQAQMQDDFNIEDDSSSE
jgi:hypothetical protein